MIFSLRFLQIDYIKKSLLAFFLFSLVTGSIYIFNDCFDKKKDRFHPDKRKRPIASGTLDVSTALIGAFFVLAAAMTAIFQFSRNFFIIAVIYIVMNILYSYFLKHIVILDVMVIAIGFVLRVKIGGEIDHIILSVWILMITFLLAIFLGLIKRRQEIVKMNTRLNDADTETRKTLKKYNLALLDQLISITTATTLISYIIYVLNPNVLYKFNTQNLYLTVPFVVFGLFRYLYLTYSEGKGESAADIIFSDLPFTINIFLWLAVFLAVIFY
jgi:4-hydroxybenzoate polyprenyltransferase